MNVSTQVRFLNRFHLQNFVRFLKYFWDARDPGEKNFYAGFIRPGDLCFDIGANIGRKADIFLKLKARVVCVEPQQDCSQFLRWRYQHNKQVESCEVAVGAHEGVQTMHLCEANALSTLSSDWLEDARDMKRYGDLEWHKKIDVHTTTLDRLVERYGSPAYCKIDVEGYELNVLRGLSRPIRMISAEINPACFDRNQEVIAALSGLGPYVFNLTQGETPRNFMLDQWISAREMSQLLETHFPEYRYGELYARMTGEKQG